MYDERYMVENFAKLCFSKSSFSKATSLPTNRFMANKLPYWQRSPPPKVARHFILQIYVSYSQDDDKKFATENAFRDVPLFIMRFK